MTKRPRVLVLDGLDLPSEEPACLAGCDVVHADDAAHGLALLQGGTFSGVYADTSDPARQSRAAHWLQAESILTALPDAVAVVSPDLRLTWANAAFDHWCGGPSTGREFYEALGAPAVLGPDAAPFHTALAGKPAATRIQGRDNRYLELHITPIADAAGKVTQLVTVGRDVTGEVQQQQKLDALHQAGNGLAGLDARQLAEMSPAERVELLKLNIRRLTHDLLHYDVIEIRLLDAKTGRLEPLLQEGMTAEAAGRVLYARVVDNGTTGFVAATGKSYLCRDTAADSHYLLGCRGAHSSLTVPLTVNDQVIGTFNVESPEPNAFDEDQLQFAEMFGREVAAALHTLELLTAEKHSTASQSVEAVSREVALPVDEILNAATTLLDRYVGHEPEMAQKLRQIVAAARTVKQSIQKVGEDMAPAAAPTGAGKPAPPRLKGLRVLVADNDERVRRSAHQLLGRAGCVVETAGDGKEALTMARLSTYDAILADIRLPDLSGYEAFHKLREAQPKAKVILMTGYGYDPSHAIVKARQEGLTHVLFKPFRVDQLLAALEGAA